MLKTEELTIANRSFRAFDESRPIPREVMLGLVDLARRCPSGMNRQPLCYRVLFAEKDLDTMLKNCRFASSLSVKLPPEGQRPTGFILIFEDTLAGSPKSLVLKDVGIAAQTILLAAVEQGFGGCMLGSFDPARLLADFDIDPERYVPHLAIALGKPAERVMLTDLREGGTAYYRDEANVHYVPKRALKDVLI